MHQLSDEMRLTFWKHGFLHLPGYLTEEQVEQIIGWIAGIVEHAADERGGDAPIPYWEGDKSERRIGRIENFLPHCPKLRELLTSGAIPKLVGELMGEPAALFKEKINFKLPGGGAFAAHQDAPAYTQFDQTYHVTVCISLDASNAENGGLEFVDGRHQEGIFAHPSPDNLIIDPAIEAKMNFKLLETRPGDLLVFHSYAPHRSGHNDSDHQRRMLFATYGLLSEGDHRAEYYRFKIEHPNDPTLNVALPFHAEELEDPASPEPDRATQNGETS